MNRRDKKESSECDNSRRQFLKGMLAASAVAATSLVVPTRSFALDAADPKQVLYSPRGVAVYPDGSVFVADAGNYCIHRFAADGSYTTFGEPGSGPGQLNYPCDIALAGDRLLVLDSNNGRIQILDAETGVYKGAFGSLGGAANKLFTPEGISHKNGITLVANTRGHCVQFWDISAGKVDFAVGMFGDEPTPPAPGAQDLRFRLPTAAVLDDQGEKLYIADSKHNRVVITDRQGQFVSQIDNASGKLNRPSALAFGGGLLYVCDYGNKRVLRVDPSNGATDILSGQWREPIGLDIAGSVLAVSDGVEKKLFRVPIASTEQEGA